MRQRHIFAILGILLCAASACAATGKKAAASPAAASKTSDTAARQKEMSAVRQREREMMEAAKSRMNAEQAGEDTASKRKEPITGTLYPGESVAYEGVTMTWEVSPDDVPVTSGTLKPCGRVRFDGPRTKDAVFDAPMMVNSKRRIIETKDFYAYLDDVVTCVGSHGNTMGVDAYLMYRMETSPSHREIDAAPHNDLRTVYLSRLCSIQLNQWRFSISNEPVRYPDGSEYYQIVALDSQNSKTETMPATNDASRNFGRFGVSVNRFYPKTRTAILQILAKEDPTIRGRDAYATWRVSRGENYGEILDRLSKEYGFEVEWVEFPGHPESVEYARNLKINSGGGVGRIVLQKTLRSFFGDSLVLDWRDATYLRVWAKGYDDVIAIQEEAARRKEKEAQGNKARAKFDKDEAQAKKRFLDLFEKDYQLETRVYRPSRISAQAARELAQGELNTYHLMKHPTYSITVPGDVWTPQCYGGPEGFFFIVPQKDIERSPAKWVLPIQPEDWKRLSLACVTETIAADEKNNALIVTAIPKTHERIVALLKKMEGYLEDKTSQTAPVRYRLQAFLLEGKRAEREAVSVTTRTMAAAGGAGSAGGASAVAAERYGLAKEDLALFGLTHVEELGQGAVALLAERGESGRARLSLTDAYACELEYQDTRKPYLIVRGRLLETGPIGPIGPIGQKVPTAPVSPASATASQKTLLENTLYLEPNKPSVLGLTNLRQALILVLRWTPGP